MTRKFAAHRGNNHTTLPIAGSILTRSSTRLMAITMCLASLCTTAIADTVTSRFVCTVDSGSRSIELSYLDEIGSVPCAIKETREDGRTQLLWKANFDVSFCHRQMKVHRARLVALGWPCITDNISNAESWESNFLTNQASTTSPSDTGTTTNEVRFNSLSANNPDIKKTLYTVTATGTSIVELRPSSAATLQLPVTKTGPVQQAITTATARPPIPKTVESSSQVIFYEDSADIVTASAEPSGTPLPPRVTSSQLNSEDIRQIDDWLMYLSAQSMASIRHFMRDQQTFDAYQLAEDRKSDDIYSRLQNRIEFLQSLLEQQQ